MAPVGGMTEAVAAAKARVRGPTVTERREAEQQASAAAVQTKSKKRKEPPAADDVAEATGGCVRSDAARRGRVRANAAPVNPTAYAGLAALQDRQRSLMAAAKYRRLRLIVGLALAGRAPQSVTLPRRSGG